jgi:hypothetical protein|tara:strand:+ start:3495 stop:4169 length:675 start_codon:yes stop_codon:yes gene_type:complete
MADKGSEAQAQVAGGEAADGQANPSVNEAKVIAEEALSIAKGTQGLYQKLMEAQRQTNDTLSVLAVGVTQGTGRSDDDEGTVAKPNPIQEQLDVLKAKGIAQEKAASEVVWCQNDVKTQLRLAGLKASDVSGMPSDAEWSQNYAAAWNASRAAIDAAHSRRETEKNAKPTEEQVGPEIRSSGAPGGGSKRITMEDVKGFSVDGKSVADMKKDKDAILDQFYKSK